MKVLGIEVASSDLHWIVLDGNKAGGAFEFFASHTQALPQADADDCGNLLALAQILQNHVRAKSIDRVGVIRSDDGCSALRAKVEFAVQIGCRDAAVPCSLIPIQTVRAAEARKVVQVAGKSLWDIYNGGSEVRPKYLTKAAFAAWCVHNAN